MSVQKDFTPNLPGHPQRGQEWNSRPEADSELAARQLRPGRACPAPDPPWSSWEQRIPRNRVRNSRSLPSWHHRAAKMPYATSESRQDGGEGPAFSLHSHFQTNHWPSSTRKSNPSSYRINLGLAHRYLATGEINYAYLALCCSSFKILTQTLKSKTYSK